MKCFIIIAIILFAFIASQSYQQSSEISLDAFSLISSQLLFLEDICYNRTENSSYYEVLKEAVGECQMEFLNGSSLSLTFKDLVTADPREFYEFYSDQCNSDNAAQIRNHCNDKLKTLLSGCLNETEIEAFNRIESIAQRLYDVICKIDEDKMKHFFSRKGQDCMIDNVITIGYCYLTALPESIHEKQELLFNLIEGRECKMIEQIENCTMVGIEACEEKTVPNIFHLLFKFFRKELLCNSVDDNNVLPETARADSKGLKAARRGSLALISILTITSFISQLFIEFLWIPYSIHDITLIRP